MSGYDSKVFSQAIQHMQQEWDQDQANQIAHTITSSIGASVTIDAVSGPSLAESSFDPLAPSSNDSDN